MPFHFKGTTNELQFATIGIPSCVGLRPRPVAVYRFKPKVAGLYVFDTESSRGQQDTVIEITTSANCESLTCNDDSTQYKSSVAAFLQPKEAVYIFVSGYQPLALLSFILSGRIEVPTAAPTEAPTLVWVPDEPECSTFTPIVAPVGPTIAVLNGTTHMQRRRKLMCNSQVAPTAVFRLVDESSSNATRWLTLTVKSPRETAIEVRRSSCRLTPVVCKASESTVVVAVHPRSLNDEDDGVFILVAGLDGVVVNFTLTVEATTPPPPTPAPSTPSPPPEASPCLYNMSSPSEFHTLTKWISLSPRAVVRSLSCGLYRPTTVVKFTSNRKGQYSFDFAPNITLRKARGAAPMWSLDQEGEERRRLSPLVTGQVALEVRRGGCDYDYCRSMPSSNSGRSSKPSSSSLKMISQQELPCPDSNVSIAGCTSTKADISRTLSLTLELEEHETVHVLIQFLPDVHEDDLDLLQGEEYSLTVVFDANWYLSLPRPPEVLGEGMPKTMIAHMGRCPPGRAQGPVLFTGMGCSVFAFTAVRTSEDYVVHLESKLSAADSLRLLSVVAINAKDGEVLWSSSASSSSSLFSSSTSSSSSPSLSSSTSSSLPSVPSSLSSQPSNRTMAFHLFEGQSIIIVVYRQFYEPLHFSLTVLPVASAIFPQPFCDVVRSSTSREVIIDQPMPLKLSAGLLRPSMCLATLQATMGTSNLYWTTAAKFRPPKSDVYWIALDVTSSSSSSSSPLLSPLMMVGYEVYRVGPGDCTDVNQAKLLTCASLLSGMGPLAQPVELVKNESIVIVLQGEFNATSVIRVDDAETYQRYLETSRTASPSAAPTAAAGGNCSLPVVVDAVPYSMDLSPSPNSDAYLGIKRRLSCVVPVMQTTRIPREFSVRFRAPETATYAFRTAITPGASVDTAVEIRDGGDDEESFCDETSLPRILGCSDDVTLGDLSSEVRVDLQAGRIVTVVVQWLSTKSEGSVGRLLVDFFPSRQTSSPTQSPTKKTTIKCSKISYNRCLRYAKHCRRDLRRRRCVPRVV